MVKNIPIGIFKVKKFFFELKIKLLLRAETLQMMSVSGPFAAEGGNLGDDIFGSAPGLGWNRLVNVFFSTSSG
jgi:hypothetical protein